MLQELLKPVLAERWPDESGLVVPPGRYVISEPIVIDAGEFTDGAGTFYDSRGIGPTITANGVTLVPDPHVDWAGKAMVEICGFSCHIEGLRFDTRGHFSPPAVGLLMGSVERLDGSGHSYHGGPSAFEKLSFIGSFTVACVALVNGEMAHLDKCRLINEHKGGGSALLIGHGTSKQIDVTGRITLKGYTQTNVTVEKSRLRSSGSSPIIRLEGDLGQTFIAKNILTSDSGPVFQHTGVVAQQLVIEDNRWESWFGSYMGHFERAPLNCSIEGNFLTRHGQTQPIFAVVVCPEEIRAAHIRFSRNTGRRPVTNTRKTLPSEAPAL